ncbi:MAG: iron ABC transporter permease [Candidatus Cloacimonetes bacterium]|nr:iron ABC transporter permease [Candidatus Cloacimonadota bacterium]
MNKKALIGLLLLFLLFASFYLFFGYKSDIILLNIRLPRFLLTVLCGMTLASIGSVYQIMLNNPLAEPYILGVSSGAALGSIIGGLAGFVVLMPLFGFLGALGTMFLVWVISHYKSKGDPYRLLFSGIIAGMFISSLISLLLYLFRQDTAKILQVLMGNTGHIFDSREWFYFLLAFGFSCVCLFYLYTLSTQLNILTSGDEVASSLGVNVKKLRKKIFFVSSLLTGICVSYAGIIGFVGLIVPQLIRLVLGAEQKRVFGFSVIGGALFLLVCDFLAQHLTVLELPVGIITSFLGCPLFVYILLIKK